MANTKKLTRPQRVAAKRKSRRALKESYAALTREERKKFRKAKAEDKKTFTVWKREQEAEKKKAAEKPAT